ncbi:HdeD family acid-resistance protein [Pararhizobium sp. BT-229]|uniref:HdeD family acid-resistance protein n=1 Tax=Pararhizobium sp. BT-229 TaxID=2986923 RepID=UPI0021F69E3E|nr:HdeD family acid-resistance protein [Pararhizobium sp. BT-229]MCV9963330.1 HdeD family acid-resistance protein [Pararhizobium sp. BT-229]
MVQDFDTALKPSLREKWGWFVALGVAMIMAGGIAFGNVLGATVASVYYVGIVMLVSGMLHLVQAFRVKKWESAVYWSLSGACYTVAGVFAFLNPMLASVALTFLMAVALIVAGVFRVWTAFKLRPLAGWGWIALGGLVTLAAGLVIAAGWPVNSLWILGLFLAIDLVMQGLALIAFGVLAKG